VGQQSNWVPTSIDLEKPSGARIYDYLLGGSHNFAVDREFTEKGLVLQPNAKRLALMNRAFMRRAVVFMIEQGIRQFLDLGSGIPTVGNVHEIAQEVDPDARVVYVDYEHVAVAHSQLLLEGNENAAMVHADITRPADVLGAPATEQLLDWDKPIGLLAVTIGHYILDDQDPNGVFAAYREALPSGSYLAITHLTDDFQSVDGAGIAEIMKKSQNTILPRTGEQVRAFFGDFELVEPGLVTTSQWRPEREADPDDNPEDDGLYAGVARKN
jgi:hypothetical protein